MPLQALADSVREACEVRERVAEVEAAALKANFEAETLRRRLGMAEGTGDAAVQEIDRWARGGG